MDKLKLALVKQSSYYLYKEDDNKIKLNSFKKIIPVDFVYKYTKETYNGDADIYDVMCLCAIVNVTKDFDPFDDSNILRIGSDTDSFQIRPKLIYKDSKGYFYKPYGKVVRIHEERIIEDFINNNKSY